MSDGRTPATLKRSVSANAASAPAQPGRRAVRRRRAARAHGTVDTRNERCNCRLEARETPVGHRDRRGRRRCRTGDMGAPCRIVVRAYDDGLTRLDTDELDVGPEEVEVAQLPLPVPVTTDRGVGVRPARSATSAHRASARRNARSSQVVARRVGPDEEMLDTPALAFPRRTHRAASPRSPGRQTCPRRRPGHGRCSRPIHRSSGCRSAGPPSRAAAPRSARQTASSASPRRMTVHVAMRADLDQYHVAVARGDAIDQGRIERAKVGHVRARARTTV